jgi:surface-anchored protein
VDQIFLGIRADAGSVATGSFGSYFETDTRVAATAPWIKVQLTGMTFTPPESTSETGAAAFSLWQTDATGTTVWMSTADGIGVSDATWLAAGGHAHYNWGFSRAGHYALRFQFSGYTGSGQLSLSQSPEFTFHFGVEHTPLTIPEPSTSAQFAGALCAGLAILRSPSRRKKQRSPAP